MFERFTDRARKVMALANEEAKRFNHDYLGTEHLLLGLVKEGSGVGANVLKNLDVDLRKVRLEVERLVKPGPEMVTMGKLPAAATAKKAIEYALVEAQHLSHNYVGTEHLILGLIRETNGIAAQVLRGLGLNLEGVRAEVLNLLGAEARGQVDQVTDEPAAPSVASPQPPVLLPDCPLCATIKALELGTHPGFVAALPECWVMLGDNQGCPGWCVLIYKNHLEHLAQLPIARQQGVWRDVARVAAAIRAVFPKSGKGGGPPRINYECLGNQVAHVHWHIIPRHADDPDPTKPVWGWPEAQLKGAMSEAERGALIKQLRMQLTA